MPLGLLKYGLKRGAGIERVLPGRRDLKSSYDVVIIGAGGHGLATAYYLAREHGITNVAVLDKGYLGGGNTARNTAIIRSNYLTPDGVRKRRPPRPARWDWRTSRPCRASVSRVRVPMNGCGSGVLRAWIRTIAPTAKAAATWPSGWPPARR